MRRKGSNIAKEITDEYRRKQQYVKQQEALKKRKERVEQNTIK